MVSGNCPGVAAEPGEVVPATICDGSEQEMHPVTRDGHGHEQIAALLRERIAEQDAEVSRAKAARKDARKRRRKAASASGGNA